MRNRSMFKRITMLEDREVNSMAIHLALKARALTGELPKNPKIEKTLRDLEEFAEAVDWMHSMPCGYWQHCKRDPKRALLGDEDHRLPGLDSVLGEHAPKLEEIERDQHLEEPPQWFLKCFLQAFESDESHSDWVEIAKRRIAQ